MAPALAYLETSGYYREVALCWDELSRYDGVEAAIVRLTMRVAGPIDGLVRQAEVCHAYELVAVWYRALPRHAEWLCPGGALFAPPVQDGA